MSNFYQDPRAAAAYDGSPELPVDDIPFYVDLARQSQAAGQSVLELACGTGRVTIPMAETGAQVVGLDNSRHMLAIAEGKKGDRANLRFVEGDLASFELGQQFGLIAIPFRSFLILLTVADQKQCLQHIFEHLVPGGRLALNFFNPSLLMMGEWLGARRGNLQRLAAWQDEGKRFQSWQTNHYETAQQQLDHLRLTEELSDDGAVISRVYRNLRLRYVFCYEMEHLLALTGFEVEALYGWFDGRPFDDQSAEMVWLARRPTG